MLIFSNQEDPSEINTVYLNRIHTSLHGTRVSKTGATVQNRNSSTKNDFYIFGFKNIKYKKPDSIYPPDQTGNGKKNPEIGRSRPVFETTRTPESTYDY